MVIADGFEIKFYPHNIESRNRYIYIMGILGNIVKQSHKNIACLKYI